MGRAEERELDAAVRSFGAKCTDNPEPYTRHYIVNADQQIAAELCSGCPVIDLCDAWARSDVNVIGVAGGKFYRLERDERNLDDAGNLLPWPEIVASISKYN